MVENLSMNGKVVSGSLKLYLEWTGDGIGHILSKAGTAGD